MVVGLDRDPEDIPAGFGEQTCGDRRVDAPAHRDDRSHEISGETSAGVPVPFAVALAAVRAPFAVMIGPWGLVRRRFIASPLAA